MNVLRRYILTSFLVSFAMTLSVFTFVMSLGAMVRVLHLLARGIEWKPIVLLFLHAIPASLTFSIPMSALTSSLLVFGRLSSDNETVAMRASGVSAWQILYPPLLVAALLTLICFEVNGEWSPMSFYAQKRIRRELATMSPLKLLAEGRMVREFVDGVNLYIGRIEGERLLDVRIWDSREAGMVREIAARSGSIQTNVAGGGLRVNLRDVTISPLRRDAPGLVSCEHWVVQIPTADSAGSAAGPRRPFYMTLDELRQALRDLRERPSPQIGLEEQARKAMEIRVEMNKRFVLSASSLAFVLLGVPLGIRAHRKESSIGVAVSLLLVFAFYLFVIVAESLNRMPHLRPDLIVWAPVALAVGIGVRLTRRSD